MDIFTLYVGQGDLVAVRAGNEAIVVDAYMPEHDNLSREQIEASLDGYLAKSIVKGLILTGFDKDHACPYGVSYILSKYQPDWIMYPKYYKDSGPASEVFDIINSHERLRAETPKPLIRKSVRVDRADSRFFGDLTRYFNFELFSPHMADMDSSNNSSIVLKITGLDQTGFTYLVTGDTEAGRWDGINTFFGASLRSDVLSASHHGSQNGVNSKSLLLTDPNTVIISAGVDNSYGHPDGSAVRAYAAVAKHVFSTNAVNGGTCLFTRRRADDFETILVRHPELNAAAA